MTSMVDKYDLVKNALLKYLVDMGRNVVDENLSLSSLVENLLSKLGTLEGTASVVFLLILK